MSTRRHCAVRMIVAAFWLGILAAAVSRAETPVETARRAVSTEAASSHSEDAHPPDAQEATTVLEVICPDNLQTSKLKHGLAYGCRRCPDFTGFQGEKAGPGEGPAFELRAVMRGAFAQAGANELAAEFFGCEPHVNNFGGTLLLRQSGTVWKRVGYEPGAIGMVRGFKLRDGRELVLERGGYTGQGETTEWVSTHDFSAQGESAEHTLLSLQDTSLLFCERENVEIGDIAKLEFPDLNNDGVPDLRITARAGQVTVPALYRGHCEKKFKPSPVPTYQIDFLFDGKTLRVSPQSAATLRRLSAEDQ